MGARQSGLVAGGGVIGALAVAAVGTLMVVESLPAPPTAGLPLDPVAATAPVAPLAPAPTPASTTTAPPPSTAPPSPAPPAPDTTAPPDPPPLPQPERPPAMPYADVPVVAMGEIEIPTIGLRTPLFIGVWRTVIDHGPGYWPGTAEPGGWGNTVIAGHRSTFTQPFRHIDQLLPGDHIVVRTAAGSFTYAVTGSEVVADTALHIVDQLPGRTITLFACHPVGSEAQRYVVRGTLVS